MDINQFFHRSRTRTYMCRHLMREVWLEITGEDLGDRLPGLDSEILAFDTKQARKFKRFVKPVSPCIVLMRRPHFTPHVGVFYNGRVIHLKPSGVEYQPLEVVARGFTEVRFYQ